MTRRPDSGPGKRPFLSDEELENIQAVLLDGLEDGSFFDLWSLLSKKPRVRAQELMEDSTLQNIVIPDTTAWWQQSILAGRLVYSCL